MSTELLPLPKVPSDEPQPDLLAFSSSSDSLERDLVRVFKLLADETRVRILMLLIREGAMHVTALCTRLGQSQPAVSHHLSLLRVAGMIESRRDGKHNFYSVQGPRFQQIVGELFGRIAQEASPA